MKKFNPYCLVFVFAVLFGFFGVWGKSFGSFINTFYNDGTKIIQFDSEGVGKLRNNVDKALTESLSYHDLMMDVGSLKNNLLGTRRYEKGKDVLTVDDKGSLISLSETKYSDKTVNAVTDRIKELKTAADENGAQFLYCAAPTKGYYNEVPSQYKDYTRENYENLLKSLEDKDVPCLNLYSSLKEKGVTDETMYFNSDHHWLPEVGFLATNSILEELNEQYGFTYTEKYMDLKNYNVEHYSNYSLGSYGKKVGQFYSWNGVDDFDLITPKFETDFNDEYPVNNVIDQGDYEHILLKKDHLEKDYYHKTVYNTYRAQKYHIKVLRNNLQDNGKKILLVRDSFGQVVTPFLAQQVSEIHVVDVRKDQSLKGEKPNLKEYIEEIQPDYVMVLYNGIYSVNSGDGRYNYF